MLHVATDPRHYLFLALCGECPFATLLNLEGSAFRLNVCAFELF